MPALGRILIAGALALVASQARAADGFVLKAELGERLQNGIAIHERITSDPSRPITPRERAAISKRIGGSRVVE